MFNDALQKKMFLHWTTRWIDAEAGGPTPLLACQ
jgi:hypothetical protein